MRGIGGNARAVIQTAKVSESSIGEPVREWSDAVTVRGWLDLMGGDAPLRNAGAKLQESTHVFVGEWEDLSPFEPGECRLVCGGKVYDVLYIDDPMGLHAQVEVYLKYLGGQGNGR